MRSVIDGVSNVHYPPALSCRSYSLLSWLFCCQASLAILLVLISVLKKNWDEKNPYSRVKHLVARPVIAYCYKDLAILTEL